MATRTRARTEKCLKRKQPRSRRGREKRAKQEASNSLFVLPDELISNIGTFLDVECLIEASLTCQKLGSVLKRDEAGWKKNCRRLWNQKIHVSKIARDAIENPPETTNVNPNKLGAYDAYLLSCVDSKYRQEISRHELVFDDPKNQDRRTVWNFRYKKGAGRPLTETDPWHHGAESRKLVFLTNSQVGELFGYNATTAITGAFKVTRPFSSPVHPRGLRTTWRVVSQPLDLPKRKIGSYVRLTIGGKDVPTFIVRRSPTGNWGFFLENCWSVFASFPLRSKRKLLDLSANGRSRGSQIDQNGSQPDNNGQEGEGSRSAQEQPQAANRRQDNANGEGGTRTARRERRPREFWLSVSPMVQMREVLLSTMGVPRLPDGSSISNPAEANANV
jgi:hypothetical protein